MDCVIGSKVRVTLYAVYLSSLHLDLGEFPSVAVMSSTGESDPVTSPLCTTLKMVSWLQEREPVILSSN